MSIKINGKEYPVPESFTMGELADMEEITGQGYDMTKGGVKGMMAIALVAARRKDPSVTVEDIRQLRMDQIEAVDDEDGAAEPIPIERGASSSSAAASSETGSGATQATTPARIGVQD